MCWWSIWMTMRTTHSTTCMTCSKVTSRAPVGWDRARWARHLAVKVLAMGDIDPPRPEHAREIQPPAVTASSSTPASTGTEQRLDTGEAPPGDTENMPVTAPEPPATPAVTTEADDTTQARPDPLPEVPPAAATRAEPALEADLEAALDDDLDFSAFDDIDAPAGDGLATESEDLAAELEALLASGDLPEEEGDEVAGPGLRFAGDEEPPPLYDGDFGVAESNESDPSDADLGHGPAATAVAPESAVHADDLQLSAISGPGMATEPADAVEPHRPPPTAPVDAPDSWALLDDAALADSGNKPDSAEFGIEKLSAAEFLAPDVEAVSPDLEPKMSLELVSMEEAIAPQAYVHDHEMMLDELGSALSRIGLLGTSVDSTEAVCQFLEALPQSTRLTFLLTQHMGRQSAGELLEKIAGHGPLPVRLADTGRRAGMGEVLLVPAGQQIRLRRDGCVELLVQEAPEPSIDASLTMAANVFGRDALAIVFAGRGNDAVAGAQAIHDRGGQVWVESSSGDHFTDMVSWIFAERLVSFSGTPSELAAHLIEVFS